MTILDETQPEMFRRYPWVPRASKANIECEKEKSFSDVRSTDVGNPHIIACCARSYIVLFVHYTLYKEYSREREKEKERGSL